MPPGSATKGTKEGANKKRTTRSAAKKTSTKKGTVGKKSATPKKSWHCKRCDRAIRLPDGWTIGPAVRRHYWAKHRSVMQPELGADR